VLPEAARRRRRRRSRRRCKRYVDLDASPHGESGREPSVDEQSKVAVVAVASQNYYEQEQSRVLALWL
jgi:hypothetical protein